MTATRDQLLAQALDAMSHTQIPMKDWILKIGRGDYSVEQLQMTWHFKAHSLLEQAKNTPVPKPPSTPRPSSVFAGRGMFTVERPQDAAGLRLNWQLDAVEAQIWQRPPGGNPVVEVESPDRLAWALRQAWPGGEKALVWSDGAGFPEWGWPDGWTCMPECYWNADGGRPGVGRSVPNMIFRAKQIIGPERWGTIPVVPVIGCYDASGENPGVGVRLTVPDYLPDLQAVMAAHPCVVGWGVWRVETLADADRRALDG